MSKIAQPAPGGAKADQRKIYIDWANNKLRKHGFTDSLVQDLQKDIPDGVKLPRVIHAVIQEEVPATLSTVSNDNERRQNIEACVAFLQRKGVNCSGFTTKDVAEGSMRAILQLFFSLSQYRPRGSDGDHPPSRISRPTSPSLRQMHSVHSTNTSLAYPSSQPQSHNSHPQASSHVPAPQSLHSTSHAPLSFKPQGNHVGSANTLSPPSAISHTPSSSSSGTGLPSSSSSIPTTGGSTTVYPSGSNLKSRPSQRRTAGSTIPTGMDMMGHRRVQYKNVSLLNEDSKQQNEEKKRTPPPSGLVEPTKSGSSSPAPHPQSVTAERTGLTQPSSLAKPQGHSSGLRPPENSGLPSRSSGLKAPISSKIQSSADKFPNEIKSEAKTSSQENISTPPADKESHPPSGSKLKMPAGARAQQRISTGSGRSTPSFGFGPGKISKPTSNLPNASEPGVVTSSGSIGEKSGIARPGGRLHPPSELKVPAAKSGGEKKESEKSPVLKSPDALLKHKGDESKSGIPGETSGGSSGTAIPGPTSNIPGTSSNISGPGSGIPSFGGKGGGGSGSGYQKVKVGGGGELRQPMSREAGRSFSHPQGSSAITNSPPRKTEKSPEPERSSSVPKPTKLQQLTQLSRVKPSGGSGLVRQSDSAVKSAQNENSEVSQSKSESTEVSAENETKPVSKLAMFAQKHSSSATSSSSSGSNETISAILEETKPPKTEPELEKPPEPLEPSVNNKSKLPPPPLDINTTPETTPSKTENRSSGSSIGSFTGSINSQSESSVLELQTPSPLGGRKYVRRTSPEGMSVDETASPRDLNKLSDLSNESKEEVFPLSGSGEDLPREGKENENILDVESGEGSFSSKVKRAHSLSPKASRRILPLQPSSGMAPNTSVAIRTTTTKPSGSMENVRKNSKPVRSSLKAPRQPGDLRAGKHVTISPHSSVESFSSSDNSLVHAPIIVEEKQERVKRSSQTERPKSLEDLESHTFSIGGFPGDLHPHLLGRRESSRSEKFNYNEEILFLRRQLSEDLRGSDSTPELLETYENQLSTLKRDLESKAKMLNMYETSMADLSSKVHSLKRSLEEKDQEIKHLNEEKHKWNEYPFDQHSLAPSRLDTGALSDGGYSDGTPEFEREDSSSKKTKKKFLGRFSIRQKRNKKDSADVSSQMEVASVMSGFPGGGGGGVGSAMGNSKSMKRSAKNQASDLMSISEYSTVEGKMPDFDSKSYYDTRSEYGVYAPPLINEETGITIYEEEGPGTQVTVNLLTDNALINNGRMDVVILGSLRITPETSWVTMDTKICDIFKYHIDSIDLDSSLGITDESIMSYHIGPVKRVIGNALLPFTTPHQALEDESAEISITLKGAAQESCDALAYCLLINTSQLSSFIAMLIETQWIVVMGTKGTCKSTLAEGLASYLELLVKEEQTVEDEIGLIGDEEEQPLVNRFSIASGIGASGDGLDNAMRFIKHELPHRMNRSSRTPILLFDNIYDCQTIEQLISAAGVLPRRPFIISTLCSGGTTRGVPLHQLMFRHNIRVVTLSPTEEPIYGILTRNLRKRLYRLKANDDVEREAEILVNWLPLLLDHLNFFINKFHSNNVALGPRVFMNCPLEASPADMEVWFINLWNHFIIPYLMGTIMAGIETYSADPNLLWIDVREWVLDSYPWPHSHSVNKLKTLSPEDVGWNHAVRPQQSRLMYMKDNDTQSVLGLKNIEMAI